MYQRFASRVVASAAVLFALTAAAVAGDWRIVQQSGEVWVGSDAAQSVSLGKTDTVDDGATLMTGKSGRVLLQRGAQSMMIGPNAVVTVPTGDESSFATVLQRSGSVEFEVDSQKTPHFAVETPYLAAVVKGTHFVVSVRDGIGSVAVTRGLVEVTNLATGEQVDTPAGRTVSVSGSPMRFNLNGLDQYLRQGSPRAPQVEALSGQDVATLQSGAKARSGAVSVVETIGNASPGIRNVGLALPESGLAGVAPAPGDNSDTRVASLAVVAGTAGGGGGDGSAGGDGGDRSAKSPSDGKGEDAGGNQYASSDPKVNRDPALNNSTSEVAPPDSAIGSQQISPAADVVAGVRREITFVSDAPRKDINPLVVAVIIACAAFFGVGLAYLRRMAH